MYYITYRGAVATVKSMLAVGQIDNRTCEVAADYLGYLWESSWDQVREQLLLIHDGTLIVEQIERDARVENPPIEEIG